MDATLVGGPYMRAQRSGAKAEGPELPAHGPVPGSLAAALVPGGSAMGPVPGRVLDEVSRTERWGKLGPARRMAAGRQEEPVSGQRRAACGMRGRSRLGCSGRKDRRTRQTNGGTGASPETGRARHARPETRRPGHEPGIRRRLVRTWVRRGGMKPRAVPCSDQPLLTRPRRPPRAWSPSLRPSPRRRRRIWWRRPLPASPWRKAHRCRARARHPSPGAARRR